MIWDVAYWHEADIQRALIHVRFWGYSGHPNPRAWRLLLTQSGHRLIYT
jgi:hypothetical protein